MKYTYTPAENGTTNMFRSDPGTVTALGAGLFASPDSFARFALDHERGVVNHEA